MYSLLYPVGTGRGDGSGGDLCHVQPPLGTLTEERVSLGDGLGSTAGPPFQASYAYCTFKVQNVNLDRYSVGGEC